MSNPNRRRRLAGALRRSGEFEIVGRTLAAAESPLWRVAKIEGSRNANLAGVR